MEKNKFKVRDVDEWKRLYIELDKLFDKTSGKKGIKTGDIGRRLQDFDLSDPRDVYDIHGMVNKYDTKIISVSEPQLSTNKFQAPVVLKNTLYPS